MDGYLLRCSKNLDIYMERNIYNVKVMATRFNEGDVKVYIKRFGVRLREQCPSCLPHTNEALLYQCL